MKKQHLDFYYDCLENLQLPLHGLCVCAEYGLINKKIFLNFTPTEEEYLLFDGLTTGWWASDVEVNGDNFTKKYGFTELRQNIVLLMAAMNNEL